MQSFLEWYAMGGYGYYVWPAYFLVCGSLALNLWLAVNQSKKVRRQLISWFKR